MTQTLCAPAVDNPTVRQIVDDYFQLGTRHISPRVLDDKRRALDEFVAYIGDKPVMECKPIDLQRYLAAHPDWVSDWTRKGHVANIKSVFNWALDNDVIVKNPFRAVKAPCGERRRHMTQAEFRAILRGTNPFFRRFVLMLAKTGMRPGEVAHMKWSDVDWQRGCITLKKHKTMKKTRKPRMIPLSITVRKLIEFQWRYSPHGIMETLRKLLANGPVPARDVIAAIRPLNPPGCSR